MYHNDTGRSRRFGFVTFEEPETLEAVMNFPGGHDVDGKKVSRYKSFLQIFFKDSVM